MICVSDFIVLPVKVDTTEGTTLLGKYLIFVISEYVLVMERASVLASIPCSYLTAASENDIIYFLIMFYHSFIHLFPRQHSTSLMFAFVKTILLCFGFFCLFVDCGLFCFSICWSVPTPCVTSESLRNVLTNGMKPCVWVLLIVFSRGLGNHSITVC